MAQGQRGDEEAEAQQVARPAPEEQALWRLMARRHESDRIEQAAEASANVLTDDFDQ